MKVRKNEIGTGLLVIVTFAILAGVLVFLGMPGVIRPLNTHRVYFDNAKGIRPGAPVLLAGREIGKVKALESPVPRAKRPREHPDYEVIIEVQVDREAEIYNNTTVLLTQETLMGQMLIDFVKGDESSGRAEDGREFIGRRIPDLTESVSSQVERLTGPGSDLAETIRQARELMEKINQPEVKDIIRNAKEVTDKINQPELSGIIQNTEQLTDTLKREPWRLLWPSTKKYGDEKEAKEEEKKTESEKDSKNKMENIPVLEQRKIGTKK